MTIQHKERVLAYQKLQLAKHYKNQYWAGAWLRRPEDERISRLQAVCTMICGGDRKAGKDLAFEALHS